MDGAGGWDDISGLYVKSPKVILLKTRTAEMGKRLAKGPLHATDKT
jgi:hypothetical protein